MNIKKLFAILLSAILLVACLASCNNGQNENDDDDNITKPAESLVYNDFVYAVNGEGTYEITGFEYNGKEAIEVNIPYMIEGRLVTGIAADAFKAYKTISKLQIPNTIEYIGEAAFYDCDKLETVTIGGIALKDPATNEELTSADHEALLTIEANAFNSCDNLKSINLPNTVVSISVGAFMSCPNLTTVNIPTSLKTLGKAAFYGCASIKSVVLPETLTDIGDTAFYGCTALTEASVLSTKLGVDIVEGEKVIEEHEIGKEIFGGCNEDLVITVVKGSEFDSYAQVHNYEVKY